MIETVSPRAILMGHTLLGMDLMPRIAARLDTGLVTDCVGLEFDSDTLLVTKPVYGGNVMAVFSLETEPYLLTIRNGAFDPLPPPEMPGGDVVALDVQLDSGLARTHCLERACEKEAGNQLQTADVVVAGGRGMGGPQGFARLHELAAIFGGAVGGSRPPCDLGWVDPTAQVGQTGEIVAPGLYIAVGISGSTQHVAGMLRSRCIVAINKDPDANIFKIADYAVVGRQEEVLPAFKAALLDIVR
jgi:electron transfer flavoprotein alpha subunit